MTGASSPKPSLRIPEVGGSFLRRTRPPIKAKREKHFLLESRESHPYCSGCVVAGAELLYSCIRSVSAQHGTSQSVRSSDILRDIYMCISQLSTRAEVGDSPGQVCYICTGY